MNIEKLICTEIELDGKKYKVVGIKFEKDNIILNVEEVKEVVQMNFGKAFEEVKKGKAMRLPQWSKDVVIKAQFPDENSKMTAPYLYVESRYGRVPWKETMIELFSEEWEVV